ncbi:MAG: type II toxin-antitoxin system RelE/ParE family toxin [Coriobacteriaceae bacterium]|nr:type II toxin-antitoxin system RelE/ParE family toxin [Coriobacteriaceae bacterium]
MAYNYVFLKEAKTELDEAAAYLSAATGSNRASANLIEQVQRAIDAICDFPAMHAISRMPELAEKGYRAVLLGSYIMLYTFEDETVYIAHIFHQRQDYAQLV